MSMGKDDGTNDRECVDGTMGWMRGNADGGAMG